MFEFGWFRNPHAISRWIANAKHPYFHTFIPQLREAPESVFLWKAHIKATGNLLPPRDQLQVGSCVGFGFTRAIETLACVEIANGEREEFKEIPQEFIYGGSRLGHNLNDDGSTGAWAAEFITNYGAIQRGKYSDYDLSEYNERNCRALGRAVPDELLKLSKAHSIKTASLVRNANEARIALANGYPIAVCSNTGISRQRDSNGMCRVEGEWPHCMAILGYYKRMFFVDNSWGTRYFVGPIGPGDGPQSGFYAHETDVDTMLRVNDSYAVSGFDGFIKREMEWPT
jgi:hypothetical protein